MSFSRPDFPDFSDYNKLDKLDFNQHVWPHKSPQSPPVPKDYKGPAPKVITQEEINKALFEVVKPRSEVSGASKTFDGAPDSSTKLVNLSSFGKMKLTYDEMFGLHDDDLYAREAIRREYERRMSECTHAEPGWYARTNHPTLIANQLSQLLLQLGVQYESLGVNMKIDDYQRHNDARVEIELLPSNHFKLVTISARGEPTNPGFKDPAVLRAIALGLLELVVMDKQRARLLPHNWRLSQSLEESMKTGRPAQCGCMTCGLTGSTTTNGLNTCCVVEEETGEVIAWVHEHKEE